MQATGQKVVRTNQVQHGASAAERQKLEEAPVNPTSHFLLKTETLHSPPSLLNLQSDRSWVLLELLS